MKRRNLSHLKLTIFLILLAVLIFAAATLILKIVKNASTQVLSWSEAVEAVSSEPVKNVQTSLSVPTQITKIGDDYFLVDCYHNQILTSKTPDAPLTDWYVMTDQINRGHTIAGDGTVYLADDTENNRVLIFEKQDGQFYLTQLFNEIGTRPHYVVYDETEKRFYVLSSMTGQLYVFYRPDPDSSSVASKKYSLCRSWTDLCPLLYNRPATTCTLFPGNQSILRTRKKDLKILERFPVPAEISGMIQLTHIQDWFYITVSTDLTGNQDYATILRVQDLNDLSSGSWEDIYDNFVGGGTPYYISSFDGHYYLTEHRIPGHSVWQFDVIDNALTDIRALF